MKELIEAFRALRRAPIALWMVIFAFAFDAMAYFGILTLMKPYLKSDLGIPPQYASWWVSVFSAVLTIVMIFVGRPVEGKLGIRKGIVFGLILVLVGRCLYGTAPFAGGTATLAVGLVLVALAEGIIQPVCYAGVKKYTDEKTGPMGYAMLYAGLNFGAMLVGPLSASVRTRYDAKHAAGASVLSGFNAVNWVCVGATLATLVVFLVFMTKKAEANVLRQTDAPASGASAEAAKRSPLKDVRFLFFIFALLPVRTLFAHQWLTMPEYVLHAYPKAVADNMETLVESINPLVIVFGVPTITALTKRYHVVTMMIVGSAVSALSTFLLVTGVHASMLITYFVIFSIGEALWSSRFMEYAAELAPPGRVAQYMGIANLPWFVAKLTTGFYAGFMLEKFVPEHGTQRPEMLWLIYGAIAMLSPIALIAARKWLLAGMQPAKATDAPAESPAAAA